MISAEQVSNYKKWISWFISGASFLAASIVSITQSEFRPKLALNVSLILVAVWIIIWLFFGGIRIAPNVKTKSPGKLINFFFVGAIAILWLPYFFKPFQAQKVEIILDVSGRMGAQFDPPGTTKLEAAIKGIQMELDILEHQNVKVSLRLIRSGKDVQCAIDPRGSLAVDFTRDLDKIRDYLKTIRVNPVDKAPVVDAIDLSIDHYQNEKELDEEFFILSFLGGDDTCGGEIDLYMNSPKVKANPVNTDLFLIILLGTNEEDFLKNIPNAKLNFARNAKQVQNIVDSNKKWIATPTPVIKLRFPVNTKDSPTSVAQEQNTEAAPSANENVPQPPTIEPPALEIPNTGQDEKDKLPTSIMTRAPSSTPVPTRTSTKTPTRTPTGTSIPSKTPTAIPSNTSTKTPSKTPTDVIINTPPDTLTHTPTPTPTDTPTHTPTLTVPPIFDITYIPTIQPDIFSPGCPLINEARVFAQFSQNQAGISATVVTDGYSNQVMRLDFTNVSGVGGNYAGWEIWLGADDQSGIPFSAYNLLVFNIRGQVGGEEPNVYLMMPAIGQDYQRYWKEVKQVAPVTTSWARVEIPLTHFTSSRAPNQQVDLSNIQRIQFLFEWYSLPTSGTIYIDDLCVQ